MFLRLHISEKTGRGVPIVISKYSEKAYVFEDDGILVTIPFNFIHEVGYKVGDKSSHRNTTPPARLSYERHAAFLLRRAVLAGCRQAEKA